MRLTKNFTLAEFTKSQTAERYGIDNTPGTREYNNLKLLCENILQPLRDDIEKPITINSGFRSLELNQMIGSSNTSQHVIGKAADIEVMGLSNFDLALYISHMYNYDQLILEYHYQGDPRSGWVHVSYNGRANRMQQLTINKHGTFPGIIH